MRPRGGGGKGNGRPGGRGGGATGKGGRTRARAGAGGAKGHLDAGRRATTRHSVGAASIAATHSAPATMLRSSSSISGAAAMRRRRSSGRGYRAERKETSRIGAYKKRFFLSSPGLRRWSRRHSSSTIHMMMRQPDEHDHAGDANGSRASVASFDLGPASQKRAVERHSSHAFPRCAWRLQSVVLHAFASFREPPMHSTQKSRKATSRDRFAFSTMAGYFFAISSRNVTWPPSQSRRATDLGVVTLSWPSRRVSSFCSVVARTLMSTSFTHGPYLDPLLLPPSRSENKC